MNIPRMRISIKVEHIDGPSDSGFVEINVYPAGTGAPQNVYAVAGESVELEVGPDEASRVELIGHSFARELERLALDERRTLQRRERLYLVAKQRRA